MTLTRKLVIAAIAVYLLVTVVSIVAKNIDGPDESGAVVVINQ